jgi:uncharacterized DUF497 family protein
MNLFTKIRGFDWDEGNVDKNEEKHNVKWRECEQIFFNQPLLLLEDKIHSLDEERFYAFGKTDAERLLTSYLLSEKIKYVLFPQEI